MVQTRLLTPAEPRLPPLIQRRATPQARALAQMTTSAGLYTATTGTGASASGGGGAASTITNSILVPPTDARFRIDSAIAVRTAGFTQYRANNAAFGPVYPYTGGTWRFYSDYVGQVREERVYAAGGSIRLCLLTPDGKWTAGSWVTLPNDTTDRYVKFDFGQVVQGTLMLELVDCAYGGCRISPTDQMDKPSIPVGPKILGIGASTMYGEGATKAAEGFFHIAGRMLGATDVISASVPGSGFLQTGDSDQVSTYRSRLATDLAPHASTVSCVDFQGSINDVSGNVKTFTPAQVQAEAILTLTQARQMVGPDVPIFVSSPLQMKDLSVDSAMVAHGAALAAAAAAVGANTFYIDALKWATGTSGNTGSPAGNGSRDRLLGPDDKHPSATYGHVHIARRWAGAKAAALGISL